MRFLAILALIVGIYLIFGRSKPVPEAGPASAAVASARPAEKTNFLKQPIDRAREAVKATEKRNAEGF